MVGGDTAIAASGAANARNRLNRGGAQRAIVLRCRPQTQRNQAERCGRAKEMIRVSIGAAVLAAVTMVFLLTPSSFAANQRRALAVMAVRLGAVPLGAR